MAKTSLVNSIVGNWSSILPFIQPLANAGAEVVGSSTTGTIFKALANAAVKVAAPSISLKKDMGDSKRFRYFKLNPDKEAFRYQRKSCYLLGGLGQLVCNLISFGFDLAKYFGSDDELSERFDKVSLFAVGLGIAVIVGRELYFKKDAEAENTERAALAGGLASALAKVRGLAIELIRVQNLPPDQADNDPVRQLMNTVEDLLIRTGQVAPSVVEAAIEGIPLTIPTTTLLPKVRTVLNAASALAPVNSNAKEIFKIALHGHSGLGHTGISGIGRAIAGPQQPAVAVPSPSSSLTYHPRTRLF